MDKMEAQRRLLQIKGIKIKKRTSVPDADPFTDEAPKSVSETCSSCTLHSDCIKTKNYKYLSEEFKSNCPWYDPKEK